MLEVSLSSGFMLSLFCFVILLFTGNAFIDTYLCSVAVVTQSCLTLATPWTHQAPLSIEFSRQEYWSGLPFPSPGVLPDPELKPRSPALPPDSLLTETQSGKLKNTGVGCSDGKESACNAGDLDLIPESENPLEKEMARILEWVAISFSRGLVDPGIKPRSPALQADSLTSEPPILLFAENSLIYTYLYSY